ncbi:MAG: exodeoxyribonuclease III [Desulfomonile tiedjei]|uniref:Exodeoxyribonuclease III n=1 Tax=Desulfomonile tiedjei TaxID=2358 RepID=A0A9D6V787_9BACT|nr:exodeoxyribonuclease III [Desulfomonile tiedjei]
MSKSLRLMSWNVNGIRSVQKKGFLEWLLVESPDILCIQETKATPDVLPDTLIEPDGYTSYWNSAQKKGYSGVAVYTREKPLAVEISMGVERFDLEGRFMRLDFPEFTLFNVYFPNGKMSPERLKFKMEFYQVFLDMLEGIRKENSRLIFVGDVNTAHNEIDLARPKENSNVSGFLPVEREWMDRVVSVGYVDTFRSFHPDTVQYSWWDFKTRARQRNVGWRIDYIFVAQEMSAAVSRAYILSEVMGSDHCPVGVDLIVE